MLKTGFIRLFSTAICFALISGCATYSQGFREIEEFLVLQKYDAALDELESVQATDGPDEILHYLNKAMLQRMAGNYLTSNESFETAKRLIEIKEAVSVTEQASAIVVSDILRTYTGEDYEKVLIHLYQAFNYLDLNQPSEARVEVLQVDVRLQQLTSNNKKAIYTKEAFARYMSGIIFEGLQEWDDAMIAYRKAYEAYKQFSTVYGLRTPSSLQHALLRVAEKLQFNDELHNYQNEFRLDTWQAVSDRMQLGELVFIFSNSLAPIKREEAGYLFDAVSGRMVRIALPHYESRPLVINRIRIKVGESIFTGEVVQDISAIAYKTLESQKAAITARAFARAVVKYRVSKEAARDDLALGLAMNIAGILTERADTRSWSTLPHNIHLARGTLAPGLYDVTVELLGSHGAVVHSNSYADVFIEPGKHTYLSYHWVPQQAVNRMRRDRF